MKYSYMPLYYLACLSIDLSHEIAFWLMRYGLKICKLFPVLMGFFSSLFAFCVTQRPCVPDDVAIRWRRFCQSRFLSDNVASSTPWPHSLAFNNCSPLPTQLHDIFACSSLAYWLSVYLLLLSDHSLGLRVFEAISRILSSSAPKPHWAPSQWKLRQ